MVCPPRELFMPMTRRLKNISMRVFSSSGSWRSRTILLLSAQTFLRVMVLLFLTIHFVIASLGSLVLTGKPMHLSSSLPRRQNVFLLTGFIFTRTHPTHSVDGQFARRPSVFAVKGQAQDGFALFLHNGPRLNSENLLGWPSSAPKHSTDLLWHDALSSLTGLFRSTIYRRRICTTWMRRGVNEEEAGKHRHKSILFPASGKWEYAFEQLETTFTCFCKLLRAFSVYHFSNVLLKNSKSHLKQTKSRLQVIVK